MSQATIYHNPRCSKSRQTLALLEAREVEIHIIKYLDEAPSADEIIALCDMLAAEPTDIMRHKESRFAELGLALDDDRSREDWASIIADNPILLERPIVVIGNRAAVGRPPENVLALLD